MTAQVFNSDPTVYIENNYIAVLYYITCINDYITSVHIIVHITVRIVDFNYIKLSVFFYKNGRMTTTVYCKFLT